MKIDQPNVPSWWNLSTDKKRVQEELKNWISARVILPNQEVNCIDRGYISAIYGKVGSIIGTTVVRRICGKAKVSTIRGNPTIFCIEGNAHVEEISGSSRIELIQEDAVIDLVGEAAYIDQIRGRAVVKKTDAYSVVVFVYDRASVIEVGGCSIVEIQNKFIPSIVSKDAVVIIRNHTMSGSTTTISMRK
jgi:hypothetical protein